MNVYSFDKEISKSFIHNWIKSFDGEKIHFDVNEYNLESKFKTLLELYFLFDKLKQERVVNNFDYGSGKGDIIFNFIDFRGVVIFRISTYSSVVSYFGDGNRGKLLSEKDFKIEKCFLPSNISYEEFLDFHKGGMFFCRENYFISKKISHFSQ